MDVKLFKKTYPFICDKCGEFTHTKYMNCEKCGAEALRNAKKGDYKNHKK